jgi:F-type H+-transporting ATPase subunit a
MLALSAFGLDIEPLAAQKLFSIGPLPVTNAMFFGIITAVFTVLLLLAAVRSTQLHPRSHLAYYTELLIGGIWGVAVDTFGDRKKALKHLPLLATLFTFILIGNLSGSGILPGVGTITARSGGQITPLLRPFTTDLNATLSMALLTIGLVQFYALRQLGLSKHFRHYFARPLWNPLNIFMGLNEIFSELLRIVTLSMRLFGVIYAGEVLISAVGQLAGNFAWIATVPVVLLEIFFSLIQAYVFMMLSATYIAVATEDSEKHSNSVQDRDNEQRLQEVS